MKLNKDNWTWVKLVDVCYKREENDRVNATKRFDRYLKVEHMDADSIHVKNWGDIAKDEIPPTFYKIFRKGQILFPTRNPHLRRTVIAPFDGICGEKTLTLEPNKDVILQDFFPFIFQSNSFINHTTGSIIGSTNPHVRWRDVADFKFLLPPKDQQTKLAELLWAGDDVKLKSEYLLEKIDTIYQSKMIELANENIKNADGLIKDVLTLEYGNPLKESDRIDGDFVVIGSAGIVGTHNKYQLKGPGIVIGRKGGAGNVIYTEQDFWPIDTAFWVKLKSDNFKIKFLFYLLKSLNLPSLSITTAVPGINREDIHLKKIKYFSPSEQESIIEYFAKIENSQNSLKIKLLNEKMIQANLINHIFYQ